MGDLNPQERQASTGQWKQSVAEHLPGWCSAWGYGPSKGGCSELLTVSRRMNTCSEDDKAGGTKNFQLMRCRVGLAGRSHIVDFNL